MKTSKFIAYLLRKPMNKIAWNLEKQRKKRVSKIYYNQWKDNYKSYYLEGRQKFNELCRQGKIKKPQQKSLRKLLEEKMGGFAEDYKKMKFDNEFTLILSVGI